MRDVAVRTSGLVIACVLSTLSAGCASSGEPAVMSERAEPVWAYFVDAGDDGDDAWTPGCHYKCSEAECAGDTAFWGGDWCTGADLHEWTNSSPHAAESDISRHDCADECRQRGSTSGRCVRVENACDGTYPSSRCECD